MKNVNIWIPSNRPHLANEAKKSLEPYEAKIFDGSNYPSFAKLINDCIMNSEHEIMIFSNDKARGTPEHLEKILKLLDDGYGLVGLYNFGFFGFKKDLIRKVGFLDERFVGGGYEDTDFVARLKEADIAFYYTMEVPYIQIPPSWKINWAQPNSLNKIHFFNKWIEFRDRGQIVDYKRKLPEETYPYDLGEFQGTSFKKWISF